MQIKNWMMGAAVVALTACGGNKTTTAPAPEHPTVKTADQLVMSTLWFQRSGEAQYIYQQAYRLAEDMMLQNRKKAKGLRPCIIVDIDETVLDNSPYEARLIVNGESYDPESWAEWVREAKARPLPGAEGFLRAAEREGIEVYYISNRSANLLEPTVQNLQLFNLPFADPSHVLLKEEAGSSKQERRNMVMSQSKVVLVVGDQLADFSEEFSRPLGADEGAMQPEMQDSLSRFFVLVPNPMYGNFESSLYPEGSQLPDEKKVELRMRALDTRTGKKR